MNRPLSNHFFELEKKNREFFDRTNKLPGEENAKLSKNRTTYSREQKRTWNLV
jgi:hypothetical protein